MIALAGFLWRPALLLVTAAALFAGGWWKGSESVNADWQAATVAAAQAAESQRLKHQAEINSLTRKLSAKQAADKQASQSNLAKVDNYAPTDFPPLPGSWRLLHDAAARGEEAPDPAGTASPSVSLKAASQTVLANYAACLDDQARLEALQQIVRALNGE